MNEKPCCSIKYTFAFNVSVDSRFATQLWKAPLSPDNYRELSELHKFRMTLRSMYYICFTGMEMIRTGTKQLDKWERVRKDKPAGHLTPTLEDLFREMEEYS